MIKLNHPCLMQHPDDPDNFILITDFPTPEGVIPRGFVTDLASIPRCFWSIISPFELGDVGPIRHDWRYRNKLGTRAQADAGFLEDMKSDNISWWKRTTAYSLVRAFGGLSWGGKVVIEEVQPA